MRARMKTDSSAGEEMDCTALLYITTVFDDDLTPIPTDRSKGAYIHIFPDDDITGNSRLRMYKSRRIDHWPMPFKFVEHN
jgi:hypothetical protein